MLTPEELVASLQQATKIILAQLMSQLVIGTEDEGGEPRTQDEINADIERLFIDIGTEYDTIFKNIVRHNIDAKRASSRLIVPDGS